MAGVLFPAAAVISAGAELNANLGCQRRFQLFFSGFSYEESSTK